MKRTATLPTGTPTFLFTDIEGSTRLLDQVGDRYPAILDMGLGYVLWIASQRESRLAVADALAAEADAALRTVGVQNGIAHNVEGRAIIALEAGRLTDSASFVAEAVRIFAEYDNLGCAAHALEAAAVVLSPSGPPADIAVGLLGAAERFRMRSGQSHGPWEIRARGGATADRVRELDTALANSAPTGEASLQVAADTAIRALERVASVPADR